MSITNVLLASRKVTSTEELLSLGGVMEMTIINYGRNVNFVVNGVEFPIAKGAQLSLPPGSGRVYSQNAKTVKIKDIERNLFTRTYYSHPQVNSGIPTLVADDMRPAVYREKEEFAKNKLDELQENRRAYNAFMGSIIPYPHPLTASNLIGESTGNKSATIWTHPADYGLSGNYSLIERWRRHSGEDLGNDWTGVLAFFQTLSIERAVFLHHELTVNEDGTFAYHYKSTELALFDTLLYNQLDALKAYLLNVITQKETLKSDIIAAETAYDEAMQWISTWNASITSTNKYYAKLIDDNGQDIESEITWKEYFDPINVQILYTIEDNTKGLAR